ncbi:type I-E CRISPR-associated protein Cas5/CasD [Streptomyces purpurascens]|uniref:type I-E CRISPR-associated protein Cas5/CasD n=1 Tax=Streptomyces purpurascens TaxID=1924 RepID=UPI0033F557F6
MTAWPAPIVPCSREARRTERQCARHSTVPAHGADVPRRARSGVRLLLHPHRRCLLRQSVGANGLALRLAGPMQSGGERSAFSPDGDTAASPRRSALLGALATAQGITHQDTGALDRYAALEFTVRVDRPGGRRSRRAHRVRNSPLLRPARPQLRTPPAPPHQETLLPAPGYRLHMPTKLIHYAMKEAAA